MLVKLIRQLLNRGAGRPGKLSSTAELASAVKLQQAGEYAQAEALCRAILERAPHDADALHLLGTNLLHQQRPDEAIQALEQLTRMDPARAEARYSLASAHRARKDGAGALRCFRETLRLQPDFVEAYLGAAAALTDMGELSEAESCYREAIARRADFAEAHYNLARLLELMGRLEEAEGSYRRALASDPRFLLAHGNLLFNLNCHSSDPQAIYDEHLAWAKRHAASFCDTASFANVRDPQRRLRVGYVSPDLCSHPVGRFVETVLTHRDRTAFDVWCYYAHQVSDSVNARLRGLADHWVDCAPWTDAELAARVRADRIDVLVDLAGHTRHNRLLAFARRPAPVQATYLGYPTTTGLAAIDYRVTDGCVDPPGSESLNAEQPVRLPHSYFCYRAPAASPGIGPLPAHEAGHITFGSFNNCAKLSDDTVALWTRVLQAVPRAMLLLKAKDLAAPGVRACVLQRFARAGIAEEQLALRGWEEATESHYAQYNRVDIAVDTYPYNGATTTCEALWMGVPVVTLRGPTHASRMGASILAAAGLPDLVMASRERYVQKCVELAADWPHLDDMRTGLRARLRASPLMDGAAFARALEAQYRRMWQSWCAREPAAIA